MKLYAITRRQLVPGVDLVRLVRSWAEAGVDMAQLREKDLPARQVFNLARCILQPPVPEGFELFISERFDVALAAGAHGVHLGAAGPPVRRVRRRVGRRLRIAYSAHSVVEAQDAVRQGADFATLSPVFPTRSKPMRSPPLGVEPLREAARRVGRGRLFALGGIDTARAALLRGTGLAGIAMIAEFMRSNDPERTVRDLRAALGGEGASPCSLPF
jgi:thiamine-phosphate pyrophosphorylase